VQAIISFYFLFHFTK